mmetsp:Transcript_3640/g.10709  ORF Transcript_3640/g.10709 Transcript_3640/m.10709 type:complete len:234 (+) Transcript_3640:1003-1704(+)
MRKITLLFVLLIHLFSVCIDVGDRLSKDFHVLCLGITYHGQLLIEVILLKVVRLLVLFHLSCQFINFITELAPLQRHEIVQEPTVLCPINAFLPLSLCMGFLLHWQHFNSDLWLRSRGVRQAACKLNQVQLAGCLAKGHTQGHPCIRRHHAFHLGLQLWIIEVQLDAIMCAAHAHLWPSRTALSALEEGALAIILTCCEVQDEVKDGEVILAPGQLLLVLVPLRRELLRGVRL